MPRLLQGRGTIHACQIRKACARPAEGPRKARQGQREAQRAPAGSAKNARGKRKERPREARGWETTQTMSLRLIQMLDTGGARIVAAATVGTTARRIKGATSVYALA